MPQMECITCGSSFFRRGEPRKRPFCSKECRKKNKERACEQCGEVFLINGPSDPQLYCGHACGRDALKKPNANCAFCGKDVGRPKYNHRKRSFCTSECKSNYHYPHNNHSLRTNLCVECFREKGKCGCKQLGDTEWGRLIARERGNSKARFNRHSQMESNPWLRKIDAVLASLRHRLKPNKSNANKPIKCTDWDMRIDIAKKNASARWGRQVRKEQDPWWIKVQTVESNWRKKTNAAKGNKQSVV